MDFSQYLHFKNADDFLIAQNINAIKELQQRDEDADLYLTVVNMMHGQTLPATEILQGTISEIINHNNSSYDEIDWDRFGSI